MNSIFKTIDAKLLDSSKNVEKDERRFRNILAASGKLLESGEIRDVQNLYVMDTNGVLIKIAALDANPDKQTETYTVQAQADHGEVIDGELVPSIEKQFGSCRVWLESDGLHARMYFADDDTLADHAWAISEDASYSTGIDWYPDGYYGAENEIDGPVGILREISMVLTGNDPRAKTIDSNPTSEAVAEGSKEQADSISGGVADNQTNERNNMSKDMLNSDEFKAAADELINVLAKFTETTDGAEGTEKSADEVETPAETPAEETKDSKTMPVVVVRDRVVAQEKAAKTTDWLTSKEGHKAFADLLGKYRRANGSFDAAWRAELAKHNVQLDGISGLPTPAPMVQIFVDALEKSEGIISHFEFINTKSFRVNLLAAATSGGDDRASGHKKGDTKANQVLADTTRDILNKMVYKRLDIDALEIFENPELIDFRAKELVEAIIVEIERAAVIGDGRSSGTPDRRMFDGTRGFFSIKADAAAASGIGTNLASSYEAAVGSNLYDAVVGARGQIEKTGAQFLVAKKSVITAMLQAKSTAGGYLVQPGAKLEDILGVSAIYTPSWMESETNVAYLIVDKAYKMIGQNAINARPDFDTSNNQDILLDETPRGGSLGEYKSAVAISIKEEEDDEDGGDGPVEA